MGIGIITSAENGKQSNELFYMAALTQFRVNENERSKRERERKWQIRAQKRVVTTPEIEKKRQYTSI